MILGILAAAAVIATVVVADRALAVWQRKAAAQEALAAEQERLAKASERLVAQHEARRRLRSVPAPLHDHRGIRVAIYTWGCGCVDRREHGHVTRVHDCGQPDDIHAACALCAPGQACPAHSAERTAEQ